MSACLTSGDLDLICAALSDQAVGLRRAADNVAFSSASRRRFRLEAAETERLLTRLMGERPGPTDDADTWRAVLSAETAVAS